MKNKYFISVFMCVWGLTINSTREEAEITMKENGFVVNQNNKQVFEADNGRYGIIIHHGEAIYITHNTPSIIAALWSIDFD